MASASPACLWTRHTSLRTRGKEHANSRRPAAWPDVAEVVSETAYSTACDSTVLLWVVYL